MTTALRGRNVIDPTSSLTSTSMSSHTYVFLLERRLNLMHSLIKQSDSMSRDPKRTTLTKNETMFPHKNIVVCHEMLESQKPYVVAKYFHCACMIRVTVEREK